jgi:hypothetical protein
MKSNIFYTNGLQPVKQMNLPSTTIFTGIMSIEVIAFSLILVMTKFKSQICTHHSSRKKPFIVENINVTVWFPK